MMNKNKNITATELVAQLEADPEYRKRHAEQEEMRAKLIAQERQAQVPLVEELRSVGVMVNDSVYELLNNRAHYAGAQYQAAIPILIKHLQQSYPTPVREGIARALGVREAKFAWNRVAQLYQDEREKSPKDGLAAALAAIADDQTIGDVIRMCKDRRNGSSRLLLLSALERSSDQRAHETLIELKDDNDLKKEIKVILARLSKRGRLQLNSTTTLGLAETSMNFDSELVGPFLERLSDLVDDFGHGQITEVLNLISDLEVEDEQKLSFQVKYEGQLMRMEIKVFKDDVDAPDLYFFAPEKLAEKIEMLMSEFGEEYEI